MENQQKVAYFRSISEFRFIENKQLGQGSFGEVKLAVHLQTSKIYAIKIVMLPSRRSPTYR
jgi:serine/threonine protein kinase